jgi:hypothetical protein
MKNLIAALIISFSIPAGASEWQALPKNFVYKSDCFSCKILPDGSIRKLEADGQVLISKLFLHGRYDLLNGEKHDQRFFQSYEKENPVKIKWLDASSCLIEKNGILSNKKYPRAAEYLEKIIIQPNAISFDYKLKMLVPLGTRGTIYKIVNYLPKSSFLDRAYKTTLSDGSSSLGIFPTEAPKFSKIRFNSRKAILISLQDGVFGIIAGKETEISLNGKKDGKEMRMDLKNPSTYTKEAVEIPAGTIIHLSFKYTYNKHNNKN